MYLRVGNIINSACEKLQGTIYRTLTPHQRAFYLANLLVDSDDLTFRVEPWSPDQLPHQKLYGCEVFGPCADPSRYRARGWARLVGSRNYALFGAYVKVDLVALPELVESEALCAKSWDWLWRLRQGERLAELALTTPELAFGELVGWPNEIEKRLRYYESCITFLGVTV